MITQIETLARQVEKLTKRNNRLESDNELLRSSMRESAGEMIKLMNVHLYLTKWLDAGMPCMGESDTLDRLIAALDNMENHGTRP